MRTDQIVVMAQDANREEGLHLLMDETLLLGREMMEEIQE
jgi:hypothetical protein